MIRRERDGLTDRERFGDRCLQGRDRFADMARDADWNGLFEESGSRPEWVDPPLPGNRSGFAPLRQAAWHGADFAVVSRLIAHGAWRTQRTRDGRRAVDIARDRGTRVCWSCWSRSWCGASPPLPRRWSGASTRCCGTARAAASRRSSICCRR
ncbi:hypothetical protein AB0N31_29750 [Streptomyces sp. NPDC051051]|uniref:hypothetical protein n=1 Tax=Streptomyces sp. NPDC051051 TaxID=3155666 RepID=UPI0034350BED